MDLIDRLIRASGGIFVQQHEDGLFVATTTLPILP
jgi:hypothetical protein